MNKSNIFLTKYYGNSERVVHVYVPLSALPSNITIMDGMVTAFFVTSFGDMMIIMMNYNSLVA